MKNRPNKPGIHWYRNNYDGEIDGTLVGRPYGRRSGQLMVFHLEDGAWCEMEHFEDCEVSEWLGPAHPPKRVKRYELTYSGLEQSDEYDGINDGEWVEYKDVKEFLIGEEDETE